MAEGLDAVTKYWLRELVVDGKKVGLTPQTRLSYCVRSEPPKGSRLLSYAEYFFLVAMCCYSTDGAAVDESLAKLARRAGMDRKTAQRLLNGYTGRDGVKRPGLKDRGIVSVKAPSENRKGKATGAHVLQINWLALTIDPNQRGYLERRAQKTLPGMKPRPIPEDDERAEPRINAAAANAAPSDNSGKPVIPLPLGHNAQGAPGQVVQVPRTQCPTPPGHNVQAPPDTVPGAKAVAGVLAASGEISAENSVGDRGAAHVPAPNGGKAVVPRDRFEFSTGNQRRKPTTWATLHPSIRERVKQKLQGALEETIGINTYGWQPEEYAKLKYSLMLSACEEAGVWPHVAEDLAQEQYQIWLKIATDDKANGRRTQI